MGGLSKKAFQYEKIRAEEKVPSITIDAGSLLFKKTKLSVKLAEQEKITAFGIVESYNRIGYDAVGISRDDLIAGLDFFKEIDKASTFPWVSANLMDAKTQEPMFQPNVYLQKGETIIGITSLIDTNIHVGFTEKENAVILPWQEVLPSIMEELKIKSDFIILLSNLPIKDNRAITQLYPDIDIIIQAGVSNANLAPQLLNNTLICQTGKQGKQIGIMQIDWQNSPWGSKKEEQLDKSKKALDRLAWQLGKFDKYKNPLTDLKTNPGLLANYRNLVVKKNKLELQIETLSTEVASKKPDEEPSTFKNRFIAMKTTLPDHKDVVAIVDNLNEKINQIGKKQITKKQAEESPYIGSNNCIPCHQYQGKSWQKSRHAFAYTTLTNKKQQFNLDCLPCHVTGSGELDQGDAVNLAISLKAVGCENCHGPGRLHVEKREAMPSSSNITKTICLKCHTDDHDDSFAFARDVQKLNCIESR